MGQTCGQPRGIVFLESFISPHTIHLHNHRRVQTSDAHCLHLSIRYRVGPLKEGWKLILIPESGECLVTREPCDGLKDPCEHRERFM
jgi:uncharacterized protein (AIM24 family)